TLAASLASGSPKGTYTTLSALKTAFPTGNTNIYVVTADGNWYYWNSSDWVSGGVYQSAGINDGAITSEKISFEGLVPNVIKGIEKIGGSVNLFNKSTVDKTGYYSWNTGVFNPSDIYWS